ncbi:hypothetical protein D9758_002153 [Tetrapyrgos nigripes]|uniref:Uncharacterized protein n=1 Tax=Tetrapyrgos nigripes TaxID=182062 RepID=A0A8H5GNI1_9AGAR|nr:hypothetical protein D9758_002153 [Tetrapyrgos nigripes]
MSPPSSSASGQSTRRRHHRPRTNRPSTCPSAALWSLFTTVVASSTARAVPAPPAFLCPSLDPSSYNATSYLQDRAVYPSLPQPPPQTPSQSSKGKTRRRRMPVMYKEGDDGRWRKVMKYTLYGSTISVAECHTPTPSIPSVDDAISNSDITPIPSPSVNDSISPESDILDSLPSGWKPLTHEDRTALILTISLVLAFFICIFIISCILWRRSLRRMKDIERRALKKKSQSEEEFEVMAEKQLKSKRKLWARATAAWKANARYTARQRRGRRRIVLNSDAASIRSQPSRDVAQDSSSISRSMSQHPSTESLTSQCSVVFIPPEDATPQNHATTSNSPPAYLHHSPLSSHTSDQSTARGSSSKSQEDYPRPYSRNGLSDQQPNDDPELPRPSYAPPSHAAHVATDDKAVLEQMNRLASEPPSEDGSLDSSRLENGGSAPVWYDEQYEDFGSPEASQQPPSCSAIAPNPPYYPLLPPPPPTASTEKGKMREYYDFEYSSSFHHDILTVDPEPGPSAPPFESVGDSGLAPSAPPLGEDEYIDDSGLSPSAPPSEALLDAEPSVPSTEASSETRISGPSSLLSIQAVQGPPTQDGTPPGYHS